MRVLRVLGVVAGLCLVCAVVAAILAVPVSGPSMRPTLTEGDRVLLHPFGADVERFDVVAARFGPNEPLVVKRVVGLPGDTVRIVAGPLVQVRPAGEDAWLTVPTPGGDWAGKPQTCCRPDGTGPGDEAAVVPAGMLFLLGDDPAHSDDSRAFGWAPLAEVRGVVWLRVWPGNWG